jgi:hypothetical protein
MSFPFFPDFVSDDATVQRLTNSVSHSATVQRVKDFVSHRSTVPRLVICYCECHENMALTVEVLTSPTTTEQKTTIGN